MQQKEITKRRKKPSLYNYMKIDFIESAINNGVYAHLINELNDPYESFQIKENKKYVICCFTSSYNAKLMWSHYGDKHQGCVVKFKTPSNCFDDECIIKRVNYQSKITCIKNDNSNAIIERLYIKDKKWSSEKEFRCAGYIDNLDDNWHSIIDKGKTNYYFKLDVEQITFGCNAHLLHDQYINNLQVIKNINDQRSAENQIKVKKMKMDEEKYRFIIDKNFDYIEELDRLEKEELNG